MSRPHASQFMVQALRNRKHAHASVKHITQQDLRIDFLIE